MITRKIENTNRTVVFSSSKWEPQMGYSRGVRRGNMIFVAGTVAADGAGMTVGKTIEDQSDFILRKIAATLKELGASLEDVVRTDTFLTDFGHFDGYAKVHHAFFRSITPVNTTVACARLVNPDHLVEISAIAVVV